MSSDPSGAPNEAPEGARTSSTNRRMLIAVGAVVLVVAVTLGAGVFTFAQDPPLPQPTAAPTLRGDDVPMGPATHVTSPAALEITAGQPPAGGPHFALPLAPGISPTPVEDGNVIHSLEHGIVWISYRPDLVTAADLQTLRAIAQRYPRDVILSPRPSNAAPASIVSWGRRLNVTSPVPANALEEFVLTNVNKSPEPGVR